MLGLSARDVQSADDLRTIVQTAPAPGGGVDLLVSMQISAASAEALNATSAGGPALTLQPLPYTLLEDI